MRKKPLRVMLEVREPSVVEISVGERVQLDRLVRARHGCVAERHGRLLGAGVSTVDLAPGEYHLMTLSAANLRVVHGGVSAHPLGGKDPWPQPPPVVAPPVSGDEPAGDAPIFTII